MNKNIQKGFIQFTLCGHLSICECASFPFGFENGLWDLIVLVPDHCLSFYFSCYVMDTKLNHNTIKLYLYQSDKCKSNSLLCIWMKYHEQSPEVHVLNLVHGCKSLGILLVLSVSWLKLCIS